MVPTLLSTTVVSLDSLIAGVGRTCKAYNFFVQRDDMFEDCQGRGSQSHRIQIQNFCGSNFVSQKKLMVGIPILIKSVVPLMH